MLYFIYQRYDFESKSQLQNFEKFIETGCISYTKGTILKANHNYKSFTLSYPFVVFHIPKVRF